MAVYDTQGREVIVSAGLLGVGVSTLGNTAGNTGTTTGVVVLAGSNSVSLSQATDSAGATVWVQMTGGGGAGDGVNVVSLSGNTSGTLSTQSTGTVVFAGGNGITLSQSSNTVTISAGNYLTTAAQVSQVVNSLNGSTGQISLATGSSLSSSQNGSTITFGLASNITTALQSAGAYLTTAANNTHTHGSGPSITGPISVTSNSSAWSISISNYLTTAAQVSHSHGNPTLNLTNLAGTTASASNGFTLSLSHNISTAALSDHSHGSGTYTQNTGTIQWANSNGVTFGLSTNQMTASVNSTSNVGLATAQTNVTWTVNSGGLSLNAAGYAGTGTSATNATITLNSNGLAINVAPPGGGAGVTLSYYEPPWAASGRATNSSLGQNTLYFMPFDLPFYLSASRINFYISISGAMSAGNSTGTCQQGFGYALYTRDMTGAASQTLSLLTSYSLTHLSHSFTSNTRYQATHYFGLSNVTSHSTQQTAISSSNATTYLSTNINGPRVLALPLNLSMTPGRYWLGVIVSTVTGNAMTNNLSVQMTSIGVVGAAYHFGSASAATNASVFRAQQGWGSYSATTGAFPNSIAYSTDAIRHPVAMTAVHFDIRGFGTSTNQL